ncbi:hypothetical protein A4U64_22060 [Rhodococcus sp. WB1]|uniref:DUF4185 domain-containing protein n=1 Tax=Rhodococcus TaxID=1827 RepID=UPI00081A2D53|nr:MULTISPECIES: DUF4185 domain-containing protein [Rhodococcus]ANZ27071.1 hypothetical protein A4U64_22060 [Rhodococcus sp. WB1]PND49736.1 DUF4185 domain-containing protein [Rhodococcus sp. ENV425]WKW99243.1 DUF4185 domain-containing protein [Rhodococcus aetherivorans]
MRAVRSATTFSSALLLALGCAVPFAATAQAEPCGGSGSGSSGFGSSNPGAGTPQGPLPTITSGPTRTVAWVTGPRSPNRTDTRFSVSGTDLGIMWDNGGTGPGRQVLAAFGDTFGDCSVEGDEWRRNILMRSGDTELSDGIAVPDPRPGDRYSGAPVLSSDPNFAREVLGSVGIDGVETTVVPTAGISVGGTQYINFMSVRAWGEPGEWWTNASAVAYSTDNGETWTVDPATARVNTPVEVPGVQQLATGNSNFQQHAYVKHEGYVYDFGTPDGRFGPAYVSRVPEAEIRDLTAYEFWTGTHWILGGIDAAVPVVDAPVGEMSVHWTGSTFVLLYGNEERGQIEMRTSARPEGPWSAPRAVVTGAQIGGLYAPYIHPWSSGNDLYFVASRWSDYNVMLLRTTVAG